MKSLAHGIMQGSECKVQNFQLFPNLTFELQLAWLHLHVDAILYFVPAAEPKDSSRAA